MPFLLLFAFLLLSGDVHGSGPAAPAGADRPAFSARQVETLTGVLRDAQAQGFLGSVLSGDAPRSQAELETAVLRYARAQQGLGARLNPDWAMERPALDIASSFAGAVAQNRLPEWLQELPPPFAAYRGLVAGLAQYRAISEAGGWPQLPARLTVKPGQRSPDVLRLRERLAAEGYTFPETEDLRLYDQGLRESVALFQGRHGLAATGLLDNATLRALNVPVETRIAQIQANLERWRWVPRPLPAQRIEINSADASLRLLDEERPVLVMRVIVGRPKDPTPILADQIGSVTFNPSWLVPQSIAKREILPKAAREPGYLEREGFVFVPDKTDPGRTRLEQRPGPKNALGKMRFNLGNSFAIYLHDTPDRRKFDRAGRQFSHGCIRLEDPEALLLRLIEGDPGVPPDLAETALRSEQTRRIALARPMPVYLFYWTAFADEAGNINFRADSYGWDAALIQSLAAM